MQLGEMRICELSVSQLYSGQFLISSCFPDTAYPLVNKETSLRDHWHTLLRERETLIQAGRSAEWHTAKIRPIP